MIITIIRVTKAVVSNPPTVVATIMTVDLPNSPANGKTYIQYSAIVECTYYEKRDHNDLGLLFLVCSMLLQY